MAVRIGLFAEAFGFGPVSKVCTLAKACQSAFPCELIAFGDSITNEYFKREGVKNIVEVSLEDVKKHEKIKDICQSFDLAIVGIQPEWAGEIQLYRPVVYLDSLGFMWNENYFRQYPKLRNVEAFIAQDIFDSVLNLRGKGIKNIYTVGPLISLPLVEEPKSYPPVIHMGGLVNIFNRDDGKIYGRFISSLLADKVDEAICSQTVSVALNNENTNIRFSSLTNHETIARFSGTKVLYTSPGLTGLLEAAAVDANVIPLPPQNYSQALIVERISTMMKCDSVWSFLKEHYPVEGKMNEEEGVALVRLLNQKYAKSTSFRESYLKAVDQFGPMKLPPELAAENGVEKTVSIIKSLISKTEKYKK